MPSRIGGGTVATLTAGVVGVIAVIGGAWVMNDDPGARTVVPAVLLAATAAVAVLVLSARVQASPVLRVAVVAALVVAGFAAMYVVPPQAIEAAVRADAELRRRGQDILRRDGGDQVEVTRHGDPAHGLILVRDGSAIDLIGRCGRHLFERWWEYSELDGADCPLGFAFVPGG